jgi:hypothetical protein
MELFGSKKSTFASGMFLTRKAELSHAEITLKLKEPSVLLQQKKYSSAGKQFLIIWQDVQTQQQNLYSNSTFVSWDSDMATSNNGASILIKELEELGISLIRDAAMAFFLAVDEPFKKENTHRYMKRDNESSPWPKLGSEMNYNNKLVEKGTGIDLVLEDMKHPLDILLESCTSNQDVAYYLSYYYFSKRGALDIEGYYSADVECIIGQCSWLAKEAKLGMLEHALQRASGNSDIGHEGWIKACLNKLANS